MSPENPICDDREAMDSAALKALPQEKRPPGCGLLIADIALRKLSGGRLKLHDTVLERLEAQRPKPSKRNNIETDKKK